MHTRWLMTHDMHRANDDNEQMPIDEYLLKNPHKKLLYNPLAAEFGIENMSQMNHFINNQLPKFKMVSTLASAR